MALVIGVVCGRCDRYSALGASACSCGNNLALGTVPRSLPRPPVRADAGPPANPPAAPAPVSIFSNEVLKPRRTVGGTSAVVSSAPLPPARSGAHAQAGGSAVSSASAVEEEATTAVRAVSSLPSDKPSLEELMEQARNYVCRSCSTPVPIAHKFCGRCGAAIPPEILNFRTQFFGALQTPGRAKLVLIRGEGVEGLVYQLSAEQHVLGRNGQISFPDDTFVSPRHANLFYRGGKLVVRDEGSMNGVFWRVSGTVEVQPGDSFLAGEQLFKIDGSPRPNDGPAPDGTYFYTSPKHQTQFKLSQVLEGGTFGMAVCARGNTLQIGREGCDLNFASDLYMSAAHCKLDEAGGKLTLTDLGSRNGTFLRLKQERELGNGDYLFIGRKLLRVEITN
jgi:pSer/pThr/pTyr-binding forkhead associated (FHA) protein